VGNKKDGMVNLNIMLCDVVSPRCVHPGCTKRPSYGVAGSETAESCVGHKEDGMVDAIGWMWCT